jgi:hypothetical protein
MIDSGALKPFVGKIYPLWHRRGVIFSQRISKVKQSSRSADSSVSQGLRAL